MNKRTSPLTFQGASAIGSNNVISGEKYWENVRRTLPSVELESIDKNSLKAHHQHRRHHVPFHPTTALTSSIGTKSESQKEEEQEENDEKENEEDGENAPVLDEDLDAASFSSDGISVSNSPTTADSPQAPITLDESVVPSTIRCRGNSCLNDEDMDALEEQLAASQHVLRAQMLDIYKDIRGKIIYEYESEKKDLMSKYTKEITRLQTQVEDLTELAALGEQREKDHQVFLDRFSTYFVDRCMGSIGVRRTGAIAIHFQAWKRRVELKKQSLYKTRVAMQYRHQKLLKRHFFDWRFRTSQLKRQNQIEMFEKIQKEMESKLKQEFASQIHQLTQALNQAKEETRQAHDKNRQLEEDLRRLFLKGVSVMNIEALKLFQSYHEHDQQSSISGRTTGVAKSSVIETKPNTVVIYDDVIEAQVENQDTVQMGIPVEEEEEVSPYVAVRERKEEKMENHGAALESPVASSPPRKPTQQEPSDVQARLQELLSFSTRPATVSNPVKVTPRSTTAKSFFALNADTKVNSMRHFSRQAWMHTSVSPGKTKPPPQYFGISTKQKKKTTTTTTANTMGKVQSSTVQLSSKMKSSTTRIISAPTILTVNSTKNKSQQTRQVQRSSSSRSSSNNSKSTFSNSSRSLRHK